MSTGKHTVELKPQQRCCIPGAASIDAQRYDAPKSRRMQLCGFWSADADRNPTGSRSAGMCPDALLP